MGVKRSFQYVTKKLTAPVDPWVDFLINPSNHESDEISTWVSFPDHWWDADAPCAIALFVAPAVHKCNRILCSPWLYNSTKASHIYTARCQPHPPTPHHSPPPRKKKGQTCHLFMLGQPISTLDCVKQPMKVLSRYHPPPFFFEGWGAFLLVSYVWSWNVSLLNLQHISWMIWWQEENCLIPPSALTLVPVLSSSYAVTLPYSSSASCWSTPLLSCGTVLHHSASKSSFTDWRPGEDSRLPPGKRASDLNSMSNEGIWLQEKKYTFRELL